MTIMTQWQVAADDRTGAYELAGLLAGPDGIRVSVGEPSDAGVVDIATRTLDPAVAISVASQLPVEGWLGHKIDSTLRGNWAAEVRARRMASGRRLIVLPAWPDMGRTCVAGVVKLFEEPVGAMKDHLPEAAVLPHVAALHHWWQGSRPVAVCDVPDTDSMHALAAAVARFPDEQMLVAGPAGPLAAVLWARWGGRPTPPAPPVVDLPALVVCGSASALAHRQLGQLRMVAPAVEVLAVDALPVSADEADAADGELHDGPAREVAARARERLAAGDVATLVIVGGDTAAAVLGDAPRLVGGMIAPGMPWSRDEHGGGPLVVTKAGAFGGVDALARLFAGKTGRHV